ncbi:MAG: hypothetical protein B7Z66_04845 [Chromatiales bacterium 21-64-14]|nr:MAG: hypothetical protein B7Z66_04845 [Chromatiales bacterium 21-64-14]
MKTPRAKSLVHEVLFATVYVGDPLRTNLAMRADQPDPFGLILAFAPLLGLDGAPNFPSRAATHRYRLRLYIAWAASPAAWRVTPAL